MFFFIIEPAPTEISALSLHVSLPIFSFVRHNHFRRRPARLAESLFRKISRLLRDPPCNARGASPHAQARSEEHTSELQSRQYLVCRLLLEKKKNIYNDSTIHEYI